MPIAETTGGKASTLALSAVTAAAATGGVDVPVLLGAFAGAVVFVTGAAEFHWIPRLIYLFAGTTISYLIAPWVAHQTGISSVVVPAVVTGACCIMVLNGLIAKARGGSLIDGITSTISALKK